MPSTNEWVFGVQGGIDVEVTNVGEDDPSSTPFTLDITYDGSTSSGTVISALPIPYIAPGDSYMTTVTWVPDTYGPVALMGVINALFDRVPLELHGHRADSREDPTGPEGPRWVVHDLRPITCHGQHHGNDIVHHR
ncbi:MAG: hypothetical protein MZV70_77160 [Desulfobacterales bacterium]|nr:hypothetical protein [Desulfobacterales bacterium]